MHFYFEECNVALAMQISDRFRVQKHSLEALQDIRIKHRYDTLDLENDQIKRARAINKKHQQQLFSNRDRREQLFARIRYLLYKAHSKWKEDQYQRSEILFAEYPDIKIVHRMVQGLRIYLILLLQ